ncbi:MAG: hypothetical protein WD399_07390 [Thermoleophilaceae bacterium]
MLDTWDAAIVRRFDALRSPRPAESTACALAMTSDCLARLDRTLEELRRRSQHRGSAPVARGPELTALRSAAVEVAATASVDGLRRRRRNGPWTEVGGSQAVADMRASSGPRQAVPARRQAERQPVLCLLSPPLLAEIDAVLTETLEPDVNEQRTARQPEVTLDDLRSGLVETAVSAWLSLRGYSPLVPSEGRRAGWVESLRDVVAGRRRSRL